MNTPRERTAPAGPRDGLSVEETSRTFYTSKGSRTVVTYVQDGSYSSRLWVNCKPEIKNPAVDLGDATLTSRTHRSDAGARKWAAQVLA